MSAVGLTGAQATRALAGLAITRALRGKALWIALGLAIMPVILVAVRVGLGHDHQQIWEAFFGTTLLILPIIPSILVASSLADELEDKTSAYLWSRALPRWSIVAGKLVGLAPVTALVMALGLTVGWAVLGGPGGLPVAQYLRGVAGIGAAAIAGCAIAAMWATVVPRHAVAVSVAWLLVIDIPLGALPIKLRYLSSSFAAIMIGGFERNVVEGVASIVAIVAIGTGVAIWRIGKLE